MREKNGRPRKSKLQTEAISPAYEVPTSLPPIQEAQAEFLGKMQWLNERQLFAMDGRVYTTKQLIAKANELRAKRGAPPIFYPGVYSRDNYKSPPQNIREWDFND
jgi:hypothetical protein